MIKNPYYLAQIELNISNHGKRYVIIDWAIVENVNGWIIPWANWEVYFGGWMFLTIGGNIPFYVDKKIPKVFRYSEFYNGDFNMWHENNVKILYNDYAQQGDAPEPATNAFPASQQSIPPAR